MSEYVWDSNSCTWMLLIILIVYKHTYTCVFFVYEVGVLLGLYIEIQGFNTLLVEFGFLVKTVKGI